jgi:hypothetical protein
VKGNINPKNKEDEMLYVAQFDAREEATLDDINAEREAWFKKGKDKVFERMCKSMHRYEVSGISPLKIFFVIDTDDPQALNILTRHFGDLWYAMTYPVIQRGIYESLEVDKTIVCG